MAATSHRESERTGEAPLLLTIRETGHALAVSRTTVFRLLREGELPAVRLGGATRVPRASVERLISDRLADQTPNDQGAAADGPVGKAGAGVAHLRQSKTDAGVRYVDLQPILPRSYAC
jgi:excisionase family DNA binding protein